LGQINRALGGASKPDAEWRVSSQSLQAAVPLFDRRALLFMDRCGREILAGSVTDRTDCQRGNIKIVKHPDGGATVAGAEPSRPSIDFRRANGESMERGGGLNSQSAGDYDAICSLYSICY
jgi:hypothetical protein